MPQAQRHQGRTEDVVNLDQIESIIKDYRSKSDRELLAVIADLLLKLLRATKAHGKVKD